MNGCRLLGLAQLLPGPVPLTAAHFVCVAVALGALRKVLVPDWRPRLWTAEVLISFCGALYLSAMLHFLPNNGAYVGYVRRAHYVPESAWDWTRQLRKLWQHVPRWAYLG